jgi:predicted nucleic acid-binding protein
VNGFLLDTNVLSEFARSGDADPAVKQWVRTIDELALFVSVLALAEIRRGIEKLDEGKRRSGLQEWFDEELTEVRH